MSANTTTTPTTAADNPWFDAKTETISAFFEMIGNRPEMLDNADVARQFELATQAIAARN